MYKVINSLKGTPVGVVIQKDGFNISIPFDPDNTDYQAYLKWLEAGNQPEPAENT